MDKVRSADELTVLVTCMGGLSTGVNVLQSLNQVTDRKFRVIGVDMGSDYAAKYILPKTYVVPSPKDKDYVSRIREICDIEGVDVIIPLAEEELFVLADEKGKMRPTILGSNIGMLKVANDKGLMHSFLEKEGLTKSTSFMPKNVEELKDAVRSLGYPDKAVVVKPRVTSGCRGYHILKDDIDCMDSMFNQRPNHPHIRLEDFLRCLKDPLPPLVVMEYFEGDDYTVFCMDDDGEPLYVLPLKRSGLIPGMSLGGVIEKNDAVIEHVSEILRRFRFDSFVNVQLKFDPKTGRIGVYEINPRISATTIAATASGVNLVYFAIKKAIGERVPIVPVRWGTRLYRYAEGVFLYGDQPFRIPLKPDF